MKKISIVAVFAAMGLLQACDTTPAEEHQLTCAGATIGGAVLGGVVGNQFGSGSGQDIMTAGGAVAGGIAANNASGC